MKKIKFYCIALLLTNQYYSYAQEYPKYSIEALDKLFMQRINYIQEYNYTNNVVIDSNIIGLAKNGIYIPTSINIYFDNVDSLLSCRKKNIKNKELKFISYIQSKGIANLSSRDYLKYQHLFKKISTDEKLRLCFYAVYDLEMASNKKEVIIVDWKRDGRKYYFPSTDSNIFKNLKPLIVNVVTNNCQYGIATYSVFIVKNNGEAYPKIKFKDEFSRFYSNDFLCWNIISEIISVIIETDTKQEFNIIYSSLNFNCTNTVECPDEENIFNLERDGIISE